GRRARDRAWRGRVTTGREAREGLSAVGSGPWVGADPSSRTADSRQPTAQKLTTADVLEALHRATGMSIIADYYTRLYPPEQVSVHDRPLFDALNELGDAMRMRWHKEGDTLESGAWLEF